MGRQNQSFLRASMRHLDALRRAGPEAGPSKTPFPADWFDLPQDMLADLGAMAYLASLNKYHATLTLPQAMAQFEVPLRLKQYRIFRSGGFARGFITWAGLHDAAERRFALDHMPLEPQHWNGGTSKWVIDLVAPFGHVQQMLSQLQAVPNETRLRALWHNKTGTRYRIMEWSRPEPGAEITLRSFGLGQFARHLDEG